MRTVLVLFFSVVFLGFASGQQVKRAKAVDGSPPMAVPADVHAKFLGGISLPPGFPLVAQQNLPAYKAHAEEFAKTWQRFDAQYFSPMRAWSASELAPRINRSKPVFYFFGGPDILSALAYYPTASDYILGGLEPVGILPAPETIESPELVSGLLALREATNVVLQFGYFITKDMKNQLAASDFQGVVPVVLSFIALSGGEVMDVCYFAIRPDGSSVDFGAGPRPSPGTVPGVRITFRRQSGAAPQRVHYVQANVADGAVNPKRGVLAWTAKFGRGNAYLKAASYLLHEPSFGTIRSFLLRQSDSVLQDDSGMPLKFFQDGTWHCRFFGSYTGTLDIFKKYDQPSLRAAFLQSSIPLAFGTGYKWRTGESNLMLAVRQSPLRAEPAR